MNSYLDFDLMKKYPNKYNLTPKNIKTVKVLDWDRLKEHIMVVCVVITLQNFIQREVLKHHIICKCK